MTLHVPELVREHGAALLARPGLGVLGQEHGGVEQAGGHRHAARAPAQQAHRVPELDRLGDLLDERRPGGGRERGRPPRVPGDAERADQQGQADEHEAGEPDEADDHAGVDRLRSRERLRLERRRHGGRTSVGSRSDRCRRRRFRRLRLRRPSRGRRFDARDRGRGRKQRQLPARRDPAQGGEQERRRDAERPDQVSGGGGSARERGRDEGRESEPERRLQQDVGDQGDRLRAHVRLLPVAPGR